MGTLRETWRKLRRLRRRDDLEHDLLEEMRLHVELRAAELIADGIPEREAWRRARAAFGNTVSLRERSRDVWSFTHVETWLRDLSYGGRLLWRDRGWALTAILTLALGIGGTVATFTFVNAFLLRPLPFAEPDRLLHVWATDTALRVRQGRISTPDFLDFRREATLFEDLAAFNYTEEDLTAGAEPQRVSVGRVTANAFPLLGIPPARGRGLAAGTDRPSGPREAVLSEGFWRTHFGADPNVLGRVLQLNGEPHAIVGVMPARFVFPLPTTQIWAPRVLDPADARTRRYLQVLGRLKPGATAPQAGVELRAIAARLAEHYPAENGKVSARLVPLRDALNFASDIFAPMSAALGASIFFVFLIVCANVANLMLSRGVARTREMAIRAALGAARWRLVRQLMTESVLLALGGGVAGVLLAAWSLSRIAASVPPELYRVGELAIDREALGFALAVSLLAVLLFGMLPALRSAKPESNVFLKEGARASGAPPRQRRSQRLLIVGQIAMSTVLLIAAALMAGTVRELRRVPLGFEPQGALTLKLILPVHRYPHAQRIAEFHRALLDRAGALPGVTAAAVVDYLPLNHEFPIAEVFAAGAPVVAGEGAEVNALSVSPAYFEAMGVPVIRGRVFATSDGRDAPAAAILSRTLAASLFGTDDVVGWQLVRRWRSGTERTYTVAGVVGDTRHRGLRDVRDLQLYLPQSQEPGRYFRLVVRSEGVPEGHAAALRSVVHAIDPQLPVTDVRTLSAVVEEFLLPEVNISGALAEHALTALILALVGLYGVLAFTVASRAHEFGVRMALGASRASLLRLVIAQAARLGAVGVVAGLVGAFALTRFLAGFLAGVAPVEPAVFAGAAALLLCCSVLAAYVPARRAATVDPVVALRAE